MSRLRSLAVAKRPKFEKYFTDNNINDLLRLFDKYGKLINVSIEIAECRGHKDNFLLSLAVESKADYLVSGDIDLLALRKIKNTRIISWSDFIKRFRK